MPTSAIPIVIIADVNVLVYAFDESSAQHDRYAQWLAGAAAGPSSFALVDTVLSGFVRIVTHPKIFEHPATTRSAMEFVEALIGSRASSWLPSGRAVWETFAGIAEADTGIRAGHVPDAYLASLAIAHGARLATADRGFARYSRLDWFDPGI